MSLVIFGSLCWGLPVYGNYFLPNRTLATTPWVWVDESAFGATSLYFASQIAGSLRSTGFLKRVTVILADTHALQAVPNFMYNGGRALFQHQFYVRFYRPQDTEEILVDINNPA